MKTCKTIDGLRDQLRQARPIGSVGLVATMGALHEGHAALIRRARGDCKTVVVSIFVNPLQFGPSEDLARYPKSEELDLRLCRGLGVDFVFLPSVEEMYPDGQLTTVKVGRVGDRLCGRSRPGHFNGVATVVLKLFNIVGPTHGYFGEKDAQQLALIRRMVKDLNLEVEIVAVPTERDADGLALSSRNQYLNGTQRKQALSLYHALQEACRRVGAGERDAAVICAAGRELLENGKELEIDYFEVVEPDQMQPVDVIDSEVIVAGAIRLGPTRLIDNLWVRITDY